MYFKYPYSDMYALNLDWMIKAINEVQDIIGDIGNVVNSVNGESGDVTISAEMVNATDINGTLVTTNDPSNQPQNVLAAYYGNGIRVILVRNNLGAIDRCFFLSKHNSVFNLVEYVPTSSQSGVRLINGLNGDVTLTGENIMLSASDQRTIAVVIAALNNRVGTLESNVGNLSNLETYNKASLVAAINELVQTDNTIFEDIGDISELDVDAGNVVAAVNTVNERITNLGPNNTLTSDSTTEALSAAQGKALKQAIDDANDRITPTAGQNISIIDGGYIRFGKIIIFSIKFKTLAEIPQNSIIFSDIPGSLANNYFNIGVGYDFAAYSCRTGNAYMYTNVAIPANTECNLNGCYSST